MFRYMHNFILNVHVYKLISLFFSAKNNKTNSKYIYYHKVVLCFSCRGSQAWSTATDSRSVPAEVREFESPPLHNSI